MHMHRCIHRDEAASRKKDKYAELVESIKRAGYQCTLMTIKVPF